jgi:hypothetical protein
MIYSQRFTFRQLQLEVRSVLPLTANQNNFLLPKILTGPTTVGRGARSQETEGHTI